MLKTHQLTRASGILKKMEKDLQSTGLTLVGQVPDLGIYQFEIDNSAADPQEAIAFLDTVVETLQRAMKTLTPFRTMSCSKAGLWRMMMTTPSTMVMIAVPFAVIDYYQAIPIFDTVLQQTALSDVTVAVIDSGLWADCGQFDDIMPRTQLATQFSGTPISLTSIPASTAPPWPASSPQTTATALTNGIASRILGDRLHLIVGDAHIVRNRTARHCHSQTRRAIELGARIVNFSLG